MKSECRLDALSGQLRVPLLPTSSKLLADGDSSEDFQRVNTRRVSFYAMALGGLLSLAFVSIGRCGQTLIQRELFEDVGTLNASSSGDLGAVQGSFYKRPVGPRVGSSAPGWSAEIRQADEWHELDLLSSAGHAAQSSGMFGAWYYVGAVSTDGVNEVQLISLQNLAGGGGNSVATATMDQDRRVSLAFYNAPAQADVTRLPLNTWVWIGLRWRQDDTAGYFLDATWVLKIAGKPLKTLGTPIKDVEIGAALQEIGAGSRRTGGSASALGRYGAPSLYQLGTADPAQYPNDLKEPSSQRTRWYVNPFTGDDANTGLSPQQAWRTAAKISDESTNFGMMAHNGGLPKGDLLLIDTSGGSLELGSDSLTLSTDGLTVRPVPGKRIISVEADHLLKSQWSVSSAYPHVYLNSDTETDIVLWESNRWMNHPTGNSFSDVAAILEATPGSFWTDGSVLYVHPFEGGNPASNGQVYIRSQFRGGQGLSAVLMSGNNWSVTGLQVSKTCLARKTDNDPYTAYLLQQVGENSGGNCVVKNCFFSYGSKHLLGFTANATHSKVLIDHVQAEQATPYVALGGQTAFVSYMDSGFGNRHCYQYCSTLRNAGLIGSTEGVATANQPVFVSHGPSAAYDSMQILHCDWSCGPLDDQNTTARGGFKVKSSKLGEVVCASPEVLITNSTLQTGCSFVQGGTLSNSRLTSEINYFARGPSALAGKVTIKNCMIDLRQNPTNVGARYAPWSRVGPIALTFRGNSFLVPAESDLTVISNLNSGDQLKFSQNRYALGSEGWLINQYAGQDRTFAAWRKLGFDVGSVLLRP